MAFSISVFASGQSAISGTRKEIIHPVDIAPAKFAKFTDSLKNLTLSDTSKFSRKNLIHSITGTRNSKSYSPLFVINKKYLYKLDIIDGINVLQFVNQYLNPVNIYKITIVDNIAGAALYGSRGSNGGIFIFLKKRTKFNPLIAGLKMKSKKNGDNYDQYGKGGLVIYE